MTIRAEFHKAIAVFAAAFFVALASGCEKAPPPRFHVNLVAAARAELTTAHQQTIADVLEAMWGTPDVPFALDETKLDMDKLKMAAGPVRSDRSGLHTGLYREHCVHCHGISGDGMGPTASFLKPYPRDYRQGKFKFKSTERAEPPTDEDLATIVRHGIPGTAMPAFEVALAQPEIDALVEYVKYLSMRGQTELALIAAIADLGTDEQLKLDRETLVAGALQPILDQWHGAGQKIIQAPEPPANFGSAESIAKGRDLFFGQAQCLKCHGTTALGDGQRTDFDDWSKEINEMQIAARSSLEKLPEDRATAEQSNREAVREAEQIEDADERKARLEELKVEYEDTKKSLDRREQMDRLRLAVIETHALAPRTIDPRNLRLGVYRGGRRPIDLYYRFFAGINAVPMPGVGGTVKDEEVWHLVDYVMSLPYEQGGELGADRAMAARQMN
jgi:mono/diheme cytochrome c family protein